MKKKVPAARPSSRSSRKRESLAQFSERGSRLVRNSLNAIARASLANDPVIKARTSKLMQDIKEEAGI